MTQHLERFRRPGSLVCIAVFKFVTSLLLIGFVAMALVRLAPGFGTDERELDSRLSNASIEQLKHRNARASLSAAYLSFVHNAVRGDLGFSLMLNRSVRELLAERYSTTARIAGAGWLAGWSLALFFAGVACVRPQMAFRAAGTLMSTLLLCLPSALLAFGIALAQAPAACAVAAIVFARIFPIINGLFKAAQGAPYVTGARCRGTAEHRIFTRHIAAASCTELVALAGTSVAIAVGATVPVEVLTDRAGIGQLAWKAAVGRDLPLLVSITLVIAAITMFFNRSADFIGSLVRRRTA